MTTLIAIRRVSFHNNTLSARNDGWGHWDVIYVSTTWDTHSPNTSTELEANQQFTLDSTYSESMHTIGSTMGPCNETWLVVPSLPNDRLRCNIDDQGMGSSHWRWYSCHPHPIDTDHYPTNVTITITTAQRTEMSWYNETRLVEYTRHQHSYVFNIRG